MEHCRLTSLDLRSNQLGEAAEAAIKQALPGQVLFDIDWMQAQLRALGCPDEHIETEVQRMLTDPERFAEIMEMDDSDSDSDSDSD